MLTVNIIIHNRYQILRHIAGGGMGHIYEAIDQRFGSTVALKQMTLTGATAEKAFQREAQLLNRLRHAALPRVTDYFSETEGQFLVMDYIPGKDLGELLEERGQPFAVNEVLQWLDELLDVLAYLHSQDVVHRDIKPQNLKVTTNNRLILLDFGIAKNLASSRSVQAFTPQFAPLEQIQGEGTDGRSDLYSAAATVYALLTASQPQSSITRLMQVTRQQTDPLPPLHTLNAQVPPAVSAVLMQALALHTADRPSDATTMRTLLQQAHQHPHGRPLFSAATSSTPPPPTQVIVARHQAQPAMPPPPPTQVFHTPPPISPPIAPPAPTGQQRPGWLLPAIGGGLLVLLLMVGGAGLALRFFDGATSESSSGTSAIQQNSAPDPGVASVPLAATDTTDALPPLEQTTQALHATITAVAELELTAQAQTEAQAQQGTITALRATEESMNATAVALAVAQTAQAAPASGSFAPPGSVPGDMCDRATVIGSISELAIQETTQMNNIFTLASAPRGATVDVLCTPLQTDDGRVWARVRYAGREGWMSTRYLRFQGGLPVEQCGVGTVVNVAALAMREETNRGSQMLGEVPGGEQVAVLCVPEIFDDGRSWVFVRYGSIEGWMSTNFLDIR